MANGDVQAAMRQRCKESGHVWLPYCGPPDDPHYECKWCGFRKPWPKQYVCSEETCRIQEARDG